MALAAQENFFSFPLQDYIAKIHSVDSLRLMRSMPSESVNMIFADPRFNLNKKYNTYKDNLEFSEYIKWTR